MGVAGCGKTTVARELAARRGARFIEADELHSPSSLAKMTAGIPLDDGDRWPWLAALRRAMREDEHVVVACSALRRAYRDALRDADHVRFLALAVSRDEAVRRLERRPDHYMRAEMVDSQFTTFERPAPDETDVAAVDTERVDLPELLRAAEDALACVEPGTTTSPLLAAGGDDRVIDEAELWSLVEQLAETHILQEGVRRVLLVPPDHTRLHSRAGEITARLHRMLTDAGRTVGVLPALGTHGRMTPEQVRLLLGDDITGDDILEHRWRDGLVRVGEISAAEVSAVSAGGYAEPLPVEVDRQLFEGWDLVVSVGQVVPHEVIGMANFTKNIVIGLGGAATIDRTHFLGAVCGMESIMGRPHTPVRDVVDAAFDRFLAPRVPVLWLLTVTEDTSDGVVLRGLFAGRGGSGDTGGAAFRAAAALAERRNITRVPAPLDRVVCRLAPEEFHSTWLANKAVYRTRMAIADGGELVVLAPGVSRFGEGAEVDALIRRHGYRGRDATLAAVAADPDLAASLGAAAHLVHGSSDGRFTITYCTEPKAGGLTREDVEGVGFAWRPLQGEIARLELDEGAATGSRVDAAGRAYTYIANPALGLWVAG